MPKKSIKKKGAETPTENPQSRLLISSLLAGRSPAELAEVMRMRFLNQGYKLIRPGFNPTLSTMEKIAEGLTKLLGKNITVRDLIEPAGSPTKDGPP